MHADQGAAVQGQVRLLSWFLGVVSFSFFVRNFKRIQRVALMYGLHADSGAARTGAVVWC